jgi:hypothetical protein
MSIRQPLRYLTAARAAIQLFNIYGLVTGPALLSALLPALFCVGIVLCDPCLNLFCACKTSLWNRRVSLNSLDLGALGLGQQQRGSGGGGGGGGGGGFSVTVAHLASALLLAAYLACCRAVRGASPGAGK